MKFDGGIDPLPLATFMTRDGRSNLEENMLEWRCEQSKDPARSNLGKSVDELFLAPEYLRVTMRRVLVLYRTI